MTRPRLSYDDLKGQPIKARLIDGSDLVGTVVDLWMSPMEGGPSIIRVGNRDVPYHAILWFVVQPSLSDGWNGPCKPLIDAPPQAEVYTDAQGNTWWREPVRD